jgi:hypothetical protein
MRFGAFSDCTARFARTNARPHRRKTVLGAFREEILRLPECKTEKSCASVPLVS